MNTPTPFDSNAPVGSIRPIVRRNPDDPSEIEMVEAAWGTDPRFSHQGRSIRFARVEEGPYVSRRCVIPATDFSIEVGDRQYRVALDDGNSFYYAGVWDEAMADWPLCYRVITVPANAQVRRYQERHGAILQRRQAQAWLDGKLADTIALATPHERMFTIKELTGGLEQAHFSL